MRLRRRVCAGAVVLSARMRFSVAYGPGIERWHMSRARSIQRSRSRRRILLLPLALVLGCSPVVQRNDWSTYTGPGREHFLKEEITLPLPPDPFEPVNRLVWAANDLLLLGVVAPVATAWRFLVPPGVRACLVNVVDNLGFPARWVNNMLQGKIDRAGDETDRFLINSTLGVLGLFDVASQRGIRPSRQDLGRTLALRGWTDAPYLTLPLLGPSNTRDALGQLGDAALDPATYYFPASPIMAFIKGADHIDEYERFVRTNFDPYTVAKFLWTAGRSVADIDFSSTNSEPGTIDELRALSFSFEDPWFPSRAKSHAVRIPATGRNLAYELWLQPAPAPVVFILPGLGTHRLAPTSIAVAELFVRRGFSAVTISNAMHSDFMESAATVAVPGFAPADARDVHMALDAVNRDLDRRYPARMTSRVLLGMSLGGFHTLHIAAAESDSESTAISFDRYIAVNPPLQLLHSVTQLDRFYNAPLTLPPEQRDNLIIGALQKALLLVLDSDPARRAAIPFSQVEAQFLIGMNFRLALHDAIWSSQLRRNMGVLKTPLDEWHRAPATEEIFDFSFLEYFHAFVLPYYMERNSEITSGEKLFELAGVQALAGSFPPDGRVSVFVNRDDFLMTPEHIDWLTRVFGERNVFRQPTGGHMGSLYDPAVRQKIVDCVEDLLTE